MDDRSNNVERQRTYTWGDPMETAAAVPSMSGLDFIKAVAAGKLPQPPIGNTLNMTLVEVADGRVVFGVEPAEFHYNPIGIVHGGLACTMLDSSMSCAVQTKLPQGIGYTTLDININFVRAITSDTGFLRCIGEVIHPGRRIATAQGRLVDENDRLYAHGTTTCLIFPLE